MLSSTGWRGRLYCHEEASWLESRESSHTEGNIRALFSRLLKTCIKTLTFRIRALWQTLLEEWLWIPVIVERSVRSTILGGICSWHDVSPEKRCFNLPNGNLKVPSVSWTQKPLKLLHQTYPINSRNLLERFSFWKSICIWLVQIHIWFTLLSVSH